MTDTERQCDLIDESLKSIFLEEINREVPDRFKSLIEQLRAQDDTVHTDESRV